MKQILKNTSKYVKDIQDMHKFSIAAGTLVPARKAHRPDRGPAQIWGLGPGLNPISERMGHKHGPLRHWCQTHIRSYGQIDNQHCPPPKWIDEQISKQCTLPAFLVSYGAPNYMGRRSSLSSSLPHSSCVNRMLHAHAKSNFRLIYIQSRLKHT